MARSVEEPVQDLAQFEPDPDGDGTCDPPPATASAGEPDDPQWIVFPDAADESAWAASELAQIGAAPKRVR